MPWGNGAGMLTGSNCDDTTASPAVPESCLAAFHLGTSSCKLTCTKLFAWELIFILALQTHSEAIIPEQWNMTHAPSLFVAHRNDWQR
eukprot:3948675-Amphidinium_carterae.1